MSQVILHISVKNDLAPSLSPPLCQAAIFYHASLIHRGILTLGVMFEYSPQRKEKKKLGGMWEE